MTPARRFWSDVTVADRAIRLDGRALKTPARAELLLPTDALAAAVADEWRAVEGAIDPRMMPLTGLANAAIDRVAPDIVGFARGLARYAEADLLCYRAAQPNALITLSGSLVLALALAEGAMTEQQAWDAAELDELWQAEQWGEDTLATVARDDKRRDFRAAARFLALLE